MPPSNPFDQEPTAGASNPFEASSLSTGANPFNTGNASPHHASLRLPDLSGVGQWFHDRNESLKYYEKNPIRGYDALEGIGKRGIQALIAGKNPAEAIQHPAMGPATMHAAERRLHLTTPRLLQDASTINEGSLAINPASLLAQPAIDTVFDAATDPVNYLNPEKIGAEIAGRLGLGVLGRSVAHAAEIALGGAPNLLARGVGTGLKAVGRIPSVSNVFDRVSPLRALERELEPHAVNQVTGIRGATRNEESRANAAHRALVEQHAFHLRNLSRKPADYVASQLPPEIRRALDTQAYDLGSEDVRREMRARGYQPTPEQARSVPLNVLRSYKPNYVPLQELHDTNSAGSKNLFWTKRAPNPVNAQYNLRQNIDQTGSDFSRQVLERLEHGNRNLAQAREIRQVLETTGHVPAPNIEYATQRRVQAETGGTQQQRDYWSGEILRMQGQQQRAEALRAASVKPDAPLVEQNLNEQHGQGNLYLTRDQALRRARGEIRGLGGDVNAAFDRSGNLLDHKNAGNIKQRALADLARFSSVSRVAQKAQHAVKDTTKAASQYGLDTQKRVEEAVNALKTKQSLAEQAKVEKLLKARDAVGPGKEIAPNGEIFGLPNLAASTTPAKGAAVSRPLSNAIANIRDAQAVRGGAEYLPVKNAARGRNIGPVTAPVRRVASATEAARAMAEHRVRQSYQNLTAAAARNRALDELKKAAQAHLDRTGSVELPQALQQRLFGAEQRVNPTFLSKVSDLGRDAVYALGVPHMKNVGEQQVIGGAGLPGLVRGMQLAHSLKKNDPQALTAARELEQFGGTTHAERSAEPVYSKIPVLGDALNKVAERSNGALDRFETGQRLAAFQAAKKKGLSDYDAAAEVNKTFGNYGERSQLVDIARNGLGAPFAAWHLGIAPQTVSRAILKHPRAVANVVRANNLISNDVTQPQSGHDFSLGGPLENTLKLFAFPYGTADYLTGSGSLGPAAQAVGLIKAAYDNKFGKKALDDAKGYIPYSGEAGAIAGLDPQAFLEELFGAYEPANNQYENSPDFSLAF